MEIKRSSVESFLGLDFNEVDVKISLFVVSNKNKGLKKLNLENLNQKERADKLNKWAKQDRFVAVVEIGDNLFAHVHSQYIEQLKAVPDLSLDGKTISVQSLTDEQAKQLSVLGEAFEEHLLEASNEEKVKEEKDLPYHGNFPRSRQYFIESKLLSDPVRTHFFILQLFKLQLGKIITDSMRKYTEDQRELRKMQEAEDKYFDIKRTEIKKDILRQEMRSTEVQRQEQNRRIIGKSLA